MVAAYEMHVRRVLDLQRQQQADGLQTVCPAVHIVALQQHMCMCHHVFAMATEPVPKLITALIGASASHKLQAKQVRLPQAV